MTGIKYYCLKKYSALHLASWIARIENTICFFDGFLLLCGLNQLLLHQRLLEHLSELNLYSVDAALEMKRWVEQAAQTSSAHSARFSISCATSTLSTGFTFRFEHRKWNRGRNGLHQLGQPVHGSSEAQLG